MAQNAIDKLESLEGWALQIAESLADDKSNDWTEELADLWSIIDKPEWWG